MSACKDKCEYGTCGGHPHPGCGGCCRCQGFCYVQMEEEQAEQFAASHLEDDLDAILLELRDAGDSLE